MKKTLLLILLFLLVTTGISYAGKESNFIPLYIKTVICGDSPGRDTIIGAILYAVKNSTSLEPGADLEIFTDKITYPYPITSGNSGIAKVPIMVRKNGEYFIKDSLNVVVQNEYISFPDDNYLMISNDPEDLSHPGILLENEMKVGDSIRLLYHHRMQDKDKSQRLIVAVINPSDLPAELLYTAGIGGPSTDEVYIGHIAAYRYMQKVYNREAMIVEVPPQSANILISQRCRYREIISAIAKLSLLSGKNLIVKVIADDPDSASISQLINIDKTYKHGRLGAIFNQTITEVNKTYTIGSNLRSIRIGDQPYLIDPQSKMELKGNYGMFYRIRLTIENPSDREEAVKVFFAPGGGIARGTFIIHDRLIETSMVDPKNIYARREQLVTVTVPGKSNRGVEIITMPEPGSYYPVKIVLDDNDEDLVLR
ncbi:MAG: hypothetical protein V1843_01370 [bacterium]